MKEVLVTIGKRIAALLNVKTIVTFVITSVFATLALNGALDADKALTVITMVITFYFGVQHEKKNTEEK